MTVFIRILTPSNKPLEGEGVVWKGHGEDTDEKKIPFKEYAYQVKLAEGHTAYVTRPRIDKISVTVPVKDDDLKKAIQDALVQSVQDPSFPQYKNAKRPSTGVAYQTNVALQVLPGEGGKVFIHVAPKPAKKNPNPAFMRLEFNPSRLGPEGLSSLKQQMAMMSYGEFTYGHILNTARVTRVDIACDFANVPTADVLCRYHEPAKSHAYHGMGGESETTYMGVKANQKWGDAKVYNKLQEQTDKKHPPDFWGLDHMRVEVISKKRPLLKNLKATNNPFNVVEVFFPRAVEPPEELHHWATFLDSCRMRGIDGALDLLPKKVRKLYVERLEEAKALIWYPDKIWAKWEQTVDDSTLLVP